jgi:glycerophosphoryl diester phosphodiesterase
LRELREAGVATLAGVVAAVAVDRWLFVEVKPLPARDLDAATGELVSLLAPRAHTTKVLSSSLAVLGRVEEALPGVGRSLVFSAIPEWLPLGVELSPRHSLVEALLGEGRSLHPWTVDRPGRQRELARLGVASLTTNDVSRAVETLRG